MKIALTNLPLTSAHPIAVTLVKEQVVACVNMYPIKSVYIWNGELCESDEITLVMKVSAAGLAQLHARLKQLHPYELMEFIVLDIDHDGSLADYVEFVRRGTRIEANR